MCTECRHSILFHLFKAAGNGRCIHRACVCRAYVNGDA